MIPINLGSTEDFGLVRRALKQAGYTETEIAHRLGIEALVDLEEVVERDQVVVADDAMSILVTVLLQGRYASREILAARVGKDVAAAMERLGLVISKPGDDEACFCPVIVYPSNEVWIASDRWTNPDGSPFAAPEDIVYPALVVNTQSFVRTMPRFDCDDALELCAGAGLAAFIAARKFAKRAYSYDITERCTVFAEFNRRLNGLENVTVAQSDLYAAAGDQTFDWITAHPPYVPVLRPKWIYHDGGNDGESIISRMIGELPRYLRPGGRFYMLALGSDREKTYTERIREWLGESEGEFDVAIFSKHQMDPAEFVARRYLRGAGNPEESPKWKELFKGLGVQRLVYGMVDIQRRSTNRRTFTLRKVGSSDTTRYEIESVLRWEERTCTGEAIPAVLDTPLKAAADLDLITKHKIENDDWIEENYTLMVQKPFRVQLEVQPWLTMLLPRCNGTKTGRQILDDLKAEGIVHPDTPPEEFAPALTTLVSNGFVILSASAVAST